MAITATLSSALNAQFNEELRSAYLYDSMAAYFRANKLPGFAAWMTIQAAEERFHAEKLQVYLDSVGERVYFAAIPEPQAEWESPLAAIQGALAHEQYITSCIHNLVRAARRDDDIAAESFLDWYVTEQVEEEASAQAILDKLDLISDNGLGLYQLDKELSTRQQEA